MTTNAFQNAGVSGRFAALVVIRLQAIDGNHDIEPLNVRPLRRNLTKRAGHNLDVNAAVF